MIFSVNTFKRAALSKAKHALSILVMFTLCLFTNSLYSQTPTLELEPEELSYDLTSYLSVFIDESGSLTQEEIKLEHANDFIPLQKADKLYQDLSHPLWLKVTIQNSSEYQNFLLSVGLLDFAELYGGTQVQMEGMLTPYSERKHHFGRYPYLKINIFQGEEQTYYLKVRLTEKLSLRSASSTRPFHQLKLQEYTSVEEDFNNAQYLLGIHAGIMLIMILYNLVVFFFFKDRSYLYYILFIIFYLLASLSIDGTAYEYIWGNAPSWNIVSVRHLLAVSWIFYLLFAQHFLSTKERLPAWNTVLNISIGLQVTVLLLNLIGLWINWLDVLQVLLSMVVIFAISIISVKQKYRPAVFYLLANVFLLIVIVVIAFWGLGFGNSNPFDYYILQIGMTLQVVLFAAGLADRINLMQQEIANQQKERQLLIQKQNEELEGRVKQRTEELEDKNRLLTNQKREIVVQNRELEQQNEEITAQKELIEKQKESVSKAYQDIKILKEMGRKINSTLEIREIIQIAYENISKLVTSTAFGIGTVDWETENIDMIGYYKEGKHFPDYNIPLSQDNRLIVWSVLNNRDIFVNDYHEEYEQYTHHKFESETDREIPNSLIYIPLSLKGKVIGILLVQSEKRNAFTATHFDILKSLADYVTVGVDHAEAYSHVKEVNDELGIKNTQIIDSLRYAKTIQDAILTDSAEFDKAFEDYFIFYRAKDVVSGDFYWLTEQKGKILLAVVDCTGHGVPGAFMSMIGHELLMEIVAQKGITEPALILNMLHSGIRKALQQDLGKNDDGMDLSICSIEKKPSGFTEVIFSGAKSSIFYTQEGELVELRGDKKSIGGMQRDNKSRKFTNHILNLAKGEMLYLSTDGYFDQHNINRKKFGKKRFLELLMEISKSDIDQQRKAIKSNFQSHKGLQYQRDDVSVIGIRL